MVEEKKESVEPEDNHPLLTSLAELDPGTLVASNTWGGGEVPLFAPSIEPWAVEAHRAEVAAQSGEPSGELLPWGAEPTYNCAICGGSLGEKGCPACQAERAAEIAARPTGDLRGHFDLEPVLETPAEALTAYLPSPDGDHSLAPIVTKFGPQPAPAGVTRTSDGAYWWSGIGWYPTLAICDICQQPVEGVDHTKCELRFALLTGRCRCGSEDIASLAVNMRGKGSKKQCGGCGLTWLEKDGRIVTVYLLEVARQEGHAYGRKAAETGALFGSKALRAFADAMSLRCCTLEKSAANVKSWADGYVDGYGEPSTLCAPEESFNTDPNQEKEDLEMSQLPTTPLGQPDPFVAQVESAIVSAEERTNASTQLASVKQYLPVYKAAVVNSPETLAWAAEQAKWIKSLWSEVEARRTFFTKPLLEIKRRVDDVFMPTLRELSACETELKGKMGAFDRVQKEAQRAAMEASTIIFAQGGMPVDPIPEVVRAQGVSVQGRWVPMIEDEKLVPREFCSPDMNKFETRLGMFMRMDEMPKPIPGVRWERSDKVTVRR